MEHYWKVARFFKKLMIDCQTVRNHLQGIDKGDILKSIFSGNLILIN